MNISLNEVAGLRRLVEVASIPEAELLSDASPALSQMARAITVLHQAPDMISTQSRELPKIAQLKSFVKRLEDNVSFYKESKDDLKR